MQSQPDIGKPRLFLSIAPLLARNRHRRHGTLTGGRLHREQKIVIQPGNLKTRIRSIKVTGASWKSPNRECGQRLICQMSAPKQISRGNAVTIAFAAATSTLIALIEKSRRLGRENPAARR